MENPTYQRQIQRIINTTQEFASIQPQESIAQAWMQRIDEEKCLDEGLAQRLVSFNAKLTNFFENGALSEFGKNGEN